VERRLIRPRAPLLLASQKRIVAEVVSLGGDPFDSARRDRFPALPVIVSTQEQTFA
jgi:hypothetical protein